MSSTQTDSKQLLYLETHAVGAGAIAGLVAGIGMGLFLQFGTDLMPVLGAFLGATTALRGWVVHLAVSALYGVVFAFVMGYPSLLRFFGSLDPSEYALAGIMYGVVVGAFTTISILPFVTQLPWVTTAEIPPFPDVPGPGIAGLLPSVMFSIAHIVYGAVLGYLYASIGVTPD